MKDLLVDIVLFVFASPILLVRGTLRTIQRARFWKTAYSASIPCRTCNASVSLLGIFRCGCGYQGRGHLLRHCPVCHSLPRVVRCTECGCTTLLPEEP
jgi:hypothetical protein